jgi:hypothetical protein
MTGAQITTQSPEVHDGFSSADPIAQAKAMYERIEQPTNQSTTAYRHWLILFGDAVDRCAVLQPLHLSKGRDSKTAALEKIALELGIETKTVAKKYTLSRRYLKIAEIGGPGSLRSINGLKWQ